MKNKTQILTYFLCGLSIVLAIGFAFTSDDHMNSLQIDILRTEELDFISEEEVTDLLRGEANELSLPVSKWDMNQMERRVETNPFVKDAQVYRDVKGNVLVKVTQRKPIARIYHQLKRDSYIDFEGNILPTAARYTARVPLIEIDGLDWNSSLLESPYGENLLLFLQYIENDNFWRAQIAHIYVLSDGEIELIPQVTKQKVVFGMPEDIESKFEKLMIFYKKILPAKGWNTYTNVNLKFKDQIICE